MSVYPTAFHEFLSVLSCYAMVYHVTYVGTPYLIYRFVKYNTVKGRTFFGKWHHDFLNKVCLFAFHCNVIAFLMSLRVPCVIGRLSDFLAYPICYGALVVIMASYVLEIKIHDETTVTPTRFRPLVPNQNCVSRTNVTTYDDIPSVYGEGI